MNPYEALYILVPELDEETNKAAIEKFKGIVEANGGEIVGVDEWGKRRLAYPIDYKTEGYYVLMSFDSAPELPAELEPCGEVTSGSASAAPQAARDSIIVRASASAASFLKAVIGVSSEMFLPL